VGVGVLGGLAASAMIVVGCAKVTDGSSTVDTPQAAAYRTSVSVSSVSAASSASIAAVAGACQPFGDAIDTVLTDVNAYVSAVNNGSADSATTQAAVDALNHSADAVSQASTAGVSSDLKNALSSWVDAARALAGAIGSNAATDPFNDAVNKLNAAKSTIQTLCIAGTH
jgi:hypothetical protein